MNNYRYIYSVVVLFFFTLKITFAQQSDLQFKKFGTFYNYLKKHYVEKIDDEKLIEVAIKRMLEELDPHSAYIPAKDLKRVNEPLKGEFSGVGIQFNILKDTILIVSPIIGGPSEKLGIKSGDKIIKINDTIVAGIGFTNRDVANHLRGPKGTKVKVSILRNNVNKLLEFEVVRDKIPLFSVASYYMIDDKTGYIKLTKFSATSTKEILDAIDTLKENNLENLILDLRGNGGGYLHIAIQIADIFLSSNKLIVYTQGRTYPKEEVYSKAGGKFEKGKLVILVNEGSASASEIVSGAIQDWDRGLIIGRRTFGKGLVQKPMNLPDNSSVRLTISKYYTPSGRCIQRPYKNGNKKEYYEEFNNRFKHGEYINRDSIRLNDSLKFYSKVNKRLVYGGGGIVPDIFIPIDTTKDLDYYFKLVRKGIISDYSFLYIEGKRKTYKKQYKTVDNFIKTFKKEKKFKYIFEAIVKAGKTEKIEPDSSISEDSKNAIIERFIAYTARNIWDISAFYQVINKEDDAINKAIEVLYDRTFKKFKINKY